MRKEEVKTRASNQVRINWLLYLSRPKVWQHLRNLRAAQKHDYHCVRG